MPFINLKTNVKIEDELKENLKSEFGTNISLIQGKTEDWLMVEIEDDKEMYFKGSKEPCAMIEVKVYGKCNPDDLNKLTDKLTYLTSMNLNIPSSRVYVSYFETLLWGWDGYNF